MELIVPYNLNSDCYNSSIQPKIHLIKVKKKMLTCILAYYILKLDAVLLFNQSKLLHFSFSYS